MLHGEVVCCSGGLTTNFEYKKCQTAQKRPLMYTKKPPVQARMPKMHETWLNFWRLRFQKVPFCMQTLLELSEQENDILYTYPQKMASFCIQTAENAPNMFFFDNWGFKRRPFASKHSSSWRNRKVIFCVHILQTGVFLYTNAKMGAMAPCKHLWFGLGGG